jgi:hypothetical protein
MAVEGVRYGARGYGGEATVKAARSNFFELLFFFRKKKNPADVTPLGFCQAFLRKAFFALHYGQFRALLT